MAAFFFFGVILIAAFSNSSVRSVDAHRQTESDISPSADRPVEFSHLYAPIYLHEPSSVKEDLPTTEAPQLAHNTTELVQHEFETTAIQQLGQDDVEITEERRLEQDDVETTEMPLKVAPQSSNAEKASEESSVSPKEPSDLDVADVSEASISTTTASLPQLSSPFRSVSKRMANEKPFSVESSRIEEVLEEIENSEGDGEVESVENQGRVKDTDLDAAHVKREAAEVDISSLNIRAGIYANKSMYLMEGDIVMDEAMLRAKDGAAAGGVCLSCRKWPYVDGEYRVPYVIEGHFTSAELDIIDFAMKFIMAKSNIKFLNRSTERDYIAIIVDQGCWSYLGVIGGRQELSLGSGCVLRKTVAHELFHALGVGHEHQRPDRDSHVTVHLDRVCPETVDQLTTLSFLDVELSDYDISSMMHYGPTAFACPSGATTIEPKNEAHAAALSAFKIVPSVCDINELNKFYSGKVKAPECIPHELSRACVPTGKCTSILSQSECEELCLEDCELLTPPLSAEYCKIMDVFNIAPFASPSAANNRFPCLLSVLASVSFLMVS